MLRPKALTEVLGQVNTPNTKGGALLFSRDGLFICTLFDEIYEYFLKYIIEMKRWWRKSVVKARVKL